MAVPANAQEEQLTYVRHFRRGLRSLVMAASVARGSAGAAGTAGDAGSRAALGSRADVAATIDAAALHRRLVGTGALPASARTTRPASCRRPAHLLVVMLLELARPIVTRPSYDQTDNTGH